MTKTIRNFLFTIFVLLFFGLSIWILIIAFGYSISPYGFRLEKTGLFDIKTDPKNAQITISKDQNNEFLNLKNKNSTPAKVQSILPGNYIINLSIPGYHSWQKKLSIIGGQTTYLENVNLFKESLPQLIQKTDSTLIASSLSPDSSKAVFVGQNWITIMELKVDGRINNFYGENNQNTKINWSTNSKNLIVGDYLIVNNKLQNLAQILGAYNHFNFGNNNLIYYSNDSSLASYNPDNKERKVLLKNESGNKISDFLIKNNYIYILQKNDFSHQTVIEIFSVNNNQPIGKIELKNLTDYSFINETNSWLNLYDEKNKNLYLVDIKYPFSEKYDLKIINNVNNTVWKNNNELLLNGGNDLRIWQRESNKENTITRLGEKINQAFWYAKDNYLLLSTNNTIYSLELDDRNGRLYLPLVQNMNISAFYQEINGNHLFIAAKLGKQNGLYLLDLK